MALQISIILLDFCLLASLLAAVSSCIIENDNNYCCNHLDKNFTQNDTTDCPITCLSQPIKCKKIIMKMINGLDDQGTLFLPMQNSNDSKVIYLRMNKKMPIQKYSVTN